MTTYPAKSRPIFPRRRLPARLRGPALTLAALGLLLITPFAVRATPGEILVITAEDVAFRAAPGSEGRIIERLGPDDRIMEFERRDGWVRGLLFGAIGQEGWVAARFLRPERDATAGGPGAGAAPSQRTSPGVPAESGLPPDDGGDYSSRSRERVYLYCLDCGLLRRHDRRGHSFRDGKLPPVIRVVPERRPIRRLPGL